MVASHCLSGWRWFLILCDWKQGYDCTHSHHVCFCKARIDREVTFEVFLWSFLYSHCNLIDVNMKLRSKHKFKDRDPSSILLFKLGEEHNSFCWSRTTCFLISEEVTFQPDEFAGCLHHILPSTCLICSTGFEWSCHPQSSLDRVGLQCLKMIALFRLLP
jgi:hypothetical protein